MQPVSIRVDSAPASFWQRPFAQDILPFVTSIVVHLGLLAIGLLTYKAVQIIVHVESRVPITIPDPISPINGETSLTKIFPGPDDGDPSRRFMREDVLERDLNAQGFGARRTIEITALVSGGGEKGDTDSVIAVGPNAGSFGLSDRGTGPGGGDENGPGGKAGLAPFGPRDGGTNTIFQPPGIASNITRVVYLCDASGSMMNKFDVLRDQMRKSIDSLRPIQGFDVIFFQADHFLALDRQLLLAVPENKRKAFEFMDTTATRDTSDPIPGLRAAFATQPELIYLLTDGDFPNNDAVLREIQKLNTARRVRINTIAFMDRGEEYEKLLRIIAEENGGVFRFVADSDLQK